MVFRKLCLVAVITALGLLALGSVSASAVTNIRTDPSGAIFAGGAISNGASDPWTLQLTGFGAIVCLTTNSAANITGSGGSTVGGTLQALTFTNCADTLPVITVNSCHLHNVGVPTVTITATSGAGGSFVLNNTLVRCVIAGNVEGCYYRMATANGTFTNVGSVLRYTGVAVSHTAAGTTDDLGAVCGNSGSFTTTLTNVRTTTGSNPVTVTTS